MGADFTPTLDQLIRETPALWRGRDRGRGGAMARPGEHTVDTGFPDLNRLLPNGGWPMRAMIEVNVTNWGNGELQLLLPLVRRLTRGGVRVAMINPPYRPYAPALVQRGVALSNLLVVEIERGTDLKNLSPSFGSAEKLLRHPDCGLVLFWPPKPDPAQVRRLQLAADAGNGIGVIFHRGRPIDTPVGLRLRVSRRSEGVEVHLDKSRYGWRQHGGVLLKECAIASHSVVS